MQNKTLKLLVLVMVVFGYGCSEYGYRAIKKTFDTDNSSIDLSLALKGQWERVCIIVPYTQNDKAADIIGFSVDIEGQTIISSQDIYSLLITLNENEVVEMYEVPRGNIDFTPLGSKCFSRDKSQFKLIKNKYNQVWVGLHNKSLKDGTPQSGTP